MKIKTLNRKTVSEKYDRKNDCIESVEELQVQMGIIGATAVLKVKINRSEWERLGKIAGWK